MRFRPAKLVPILLAIIFLAGGATLGVLQVRWLDAFSNAEEIRARTTLATGAARVHADAEDEVRVLLSLVRISSDDLAARRWDSMIESLRFWNESSSHPLLLKGVWAGDIPAGARAYSWSREAGTFTETALPSWLSSLVGESLPTTDAPAPRRAFFSPEGDPLVVLPAYSDTRRPGSWIAVLLDSSVLYGKLVPALMADALPGYPYVVLSSNGIVFASSITGSLAGRQPEISMGLDDLSSNLPPLWGGITDRGGGRGPDRQEASDPSVRFWLLQSRMSLDAAAPLQPARPSSVVKLDVFYPNQSLSAVMHRRWILNLSLGVGILGILLVSAVILYRLYRQSVRLRASEQEFVSSMSHELRTPIAVIQATSENLSQGAVSDPQRLPRYARAINSQVKRLSAMVEGILFYSGLESGAGKSPALGEVEPAPLVEDVVQSLRPLAADARKELRLDLDGLPQRITSDATALRLLLENLLMNAIRHADPGEIRLSVSRRPFDLLSLIVEDDGPGIPAREQARIFEPFVRGERTVKGQVPGSGLGLHLVRRVAAMLGGSVKLESPYTDLAETPRPGCRFTVTLPCRETGA